MRYTENIKKLIFSKLAIDGNDELNNELLEKYQKVIKDKSYFDFIIRDSNGGFFLDCSLQLYKFTLDEGFQNIDVVNAIFLNEYKNFADDLVTIGQDVFGNQFVYDLNTQSIFLFNIETAEKEKIADSFVTFIKQIFTDIEYYSGRNFILNFSNSFELNQRLCPKIPFVIGGEYKNENFYTCTFPKYFEFFADIAKQIHEVPDGTPIRLKIV